MYFTGTGFNFATKVALWDWIFGTAFLPSLRATGVARRADLGEVPRAYGLSGEVHFPEEAVARRSTLLTTYFRQVFYAFRPRLRSVRAEAETAPAE
jgi:hypothetical protein